MDLITLGRTLGFSLAAGVNLYADGRDPRSVCTIRLGRSSTSVSGVQPPRGDRRRDRDVCHRVLRGQDSVLRLAMDLIHTGIRPVGGALIAVATLGDALHLSRAWLPVGRLGGGQQSSRQNEHPRRREHKSRAGVELDPKASVRIYSSSVSPISSSCTRSPPRRRHHPDRADHRLCSRDRQDRATLVRSTSGAGRRFFKSRHHFDRVRKLTQN